MVTPGGSASGYQAIFVPSAVLASPAATVNQPYLYTSPRLWLEPVMVGPIGAVIATLEANVLNCRVEGISASSTRVALALACDFILAVTRAGV